MKHAANFDAILPLAAVASTCPENLGKTISLGIRWQPNSEVLQTLCFIEPEHLVAQINPIVSPHTHALRLHTLTAQMTHWFMDPHFQWQLPLATPTTLFQAELRTALCALPSGTTCTYGQLAQQLHSAPRAVGQALGSNPLPLIIPCHRVISAGKNRLTGFNNASAGRMLTLKSWLLEREIPTAQITTNG